MSQLQPVTLTFDGKEYTVDKEAGIWGLIEAIEDVITLFELVPAVQEGKYPTARIFRAYSAALTYAGCKVTANQVREKSGYRQMAEMCGALCAIMGMAQPAADIDLGSDKGNEQDGEKVKKKAAVE